IGRRDEQAHVQTGQQKNQGKRRAEARDPSRQREEGLRRGVPEPVDALRRHSEEIRSAAALAQGVNAAARTRSAPRSSSCPPAESPAAAIATAPAPRISTGT